MSSGELKGSRPNFNWTIDAGILDRLAELERRIYPRLGGYRPPYKTGAEWVNDFLNKPEEERVLEYQFKPQGKLVTLGLKHTAETHLGTIYNRILHKDNEYYGGRDVSKLGHIRAFVVKALKTVQENVRHLQDESEWIFEVPLLAETAPTIGEAEEMLHRDASGYGLRWAETRAEDIEKQVKRAALLRLLNFGIGNDNMVSTGRLNFVSRILTEDDSERRMMLYWGWGNPHVFYGLDITESTGETPAVTLIEKVVVASAYRIGRDFVFVNSFPQDMVYCIPKAT